MPGRNGSGPMGEGAMTGRRMGRCANNGAGTKRNESVQNVQIAENAKNTEEQSTVAGTGRGLGLGRKGKGMGLGRGKRFGNGN